MRFLVLLLLVGCDDGGPLAALDGLPDASALDMRLLDDSVRDGALPDSAPPDATRRPDMRAPRADAGPPDAAVADLGRPDAGPAPPPPTRLLFIGNSFTFGGPVPAVVEALANDAGWPAPDVRYSAFGGETLGGHRTRRPATLALIDEGDWDVVVLQEQSTRPTENAGDPVRFKTDVTWFHDRIKQQSPDARLILYETWARHADHDIYPRTFADPEEMQAQLRRHYLDTPRWVFEYAAEPVEPPVEVARCGDAWEQHLAEPEPLRLHAGDDWHAAPTGQYLSGLVIYRTIYGRPVGGRTRWRVDPGAAERLQATADAIFSDAALPP